MNVYKKLQTCRKELKALPVKESGNNKFAGYTYMELGDFLPHIVDLCEAHGLCTIISFGEEATLTVVNSDKPEEKIVFASPMSTAELKGCHAIQNLGAVETYLRRYLYVAAFDIVEHDALDSTNGKQEEPQQRAQSRQQAPKSSPQPPSGDKPKELSPEQLKYQPRLLSALHTLHGDDTSAKKATVKANSALPAKGNFPAREGVEDYRTLDGDRLKFLTHAVEKLAAGKVDKDFETVKNESLANLKKDMQPD